MFQELVSVRENLPFLVFRPRKSWLKIWHVTVISCNSFLFLSGSTFAFLVVESFPYISIYPVSLSLSGLSLTLPVVLSLGLFVFSHLWKSSWPFLTCGYLMWETDVLSWVCVEKPEGLELQNFGNLWVLLSCWTFFETDSGGKVSVLKRSKSRWLSILCWRMFNLFFFI